MKATLNFPTQEMAKTFASKWAHYTLQGHDMSAVKLDGSVEVTVYNVTSDRKDWINSYVSRLNG